MKRYLSVDGGGTKCQVLYFDEEMHILGEGLGGGVNGTQNSAESIKKSIQDALNGAFAAGVPDRIDKLFCMGPFRGFSEALRAVTEVGEDVIIHEPVAGKMAAALKPTGMLALAGTGSDVFNLMPGNIQFVGGWGPILGDEGCGCWIGMKALQAAVRCYEGWGPKTCLGEYLMQDWNMKDLHESIRIVYHDPAPMRKAGTCTRTVSRAAHDGDEVALSILAEAGHMMAVQMCCLFDRYGLPEGDREVSYIGGAWKAHPIMAETFRKELQEYNAELTVADPLFEPVMAGPITVFSEQNPNASRDEMKSVLLSAFEKYQYNWQKH